MIDQDKPIHPRTSDAYGGITQRDWLAAMAMQGLLSDCEYDKGPKDTADIAYNYADAMIERSKQ